jgi:hypothetical protein
MGLSNEERYEKMVHSVCHITELAADLTEEKLKKLSERLWYELLKQESDGLFWIMGSDLSNDHLKGGLLGVAFCCHSPAQGQTLDYISNPLMMNMFKKLYEG